MRRSRQVNLEYLRFAGGRYENDVVLTDAEIADYAAKNEAKLKELYEQKRFVYEKVSDERKLRQILVKVPHDATDAQDKAARDKANALADKLKKGAKVSGKEGVTFAEVARSSSDDTASKAQGGELGWRAHGAANLPAVVEEKVWKAQSDAIVGPLRGTDGYVITKVEGQRDGSVSFEKVKLELAEQKLREERADAKAKAAAADARGQAAGGPRPVDEGALPGRRQRQGRGEHRARSGSRAARRGDRALLACGPRARGRSSRGSASRTRSPRRPSRSPRAAPARRARSRWAERSSSCGSRSARIPTWPSSRSARSSSRATPS